MSHVILRLDRNAQTGLPRLTVEGLTLSRVEQSTLERELHQRFGELAGKREGDVFEIRTPLKRLQRPAQFRVSQVSHMQSRRCPDVVLESVQSLFNEAAENGMFRWDDIRAAAGELLGHLRQGQQGTLRQVLLEFCQLEKEPKQKQLLSIFAGYLLLQRVLCDDNDQDRCVLLEEAMVALVKALGDGVVKPPMTLAVQGDCSPEISQPLRSRGNMRVKPVG